MSSPLTITEKFHDIEFNQVKIPLESILSCTADLPNKTVHLICQCEIGKEFKANITVYLGTAAKVKECIQVLVQHSNCEFNMPWIEKIHREPRFMLLTFRSELHVEQFKEVFLPALLPTFDSLILSNVKLMVTGALGKGDEASTTQGINFLAKRTSGHVIERLLGQPAPELTKSASPDFTGHIEKHFTIRDNKIESTMCDHKAKIIQTAASSSDIENWINLSMDDILCVQENWQKLVNALKKTGQVEYKDFTTKLQASLNSGTFNHTEFMIANDAMLDPLQASKQFTEIFAQCFM